MIFKNDFFYFAFFCALVTTGCESDRKAPESQANSAPQQAALVDNGNGSGDRYRYYRWADLRRAPGCMPRLAAMMEWYSGDSLRNFQFVNTLHAGGRYVFNEREKQRYLSALQRSGYFTKQFIKEQHDALAALRQHMLRAKQTDGEPEGLISDRVFPVTDFSDMMELQDKFRFSAEDGGKTVHFDTGEAVQSISFDEQCRIDKILFLKVSPQSE